MPGPANIPGFKSDLTEFVIEEPCCRAMQSQCRKKQTNPKHVTCMDIFHSFRSVVCYCVKSSEVVKLDLVRPMEYLHCQ